MNKKLIQSRLLLFTTIFAICLSMGLTLTWQPVDSQTKLVALSDLLTGLRSTLVRSMAEKNETLAAAVKKRGVDFELTPQIETILRSEGANNDLIAAIREKSKNTVPNTPVSPGTVRKNPLGMELVYIPPGSFMMGSPTGEASRGGDEGPQRRVTIKDGFWMGKYEVTIGEWKLLMGVMPIGMKSDLDAELYSSDKRPVVRVSWDDAKEFIRKINAKNDGYKYSLPSEAEWEYAARAGTTTAFAYGDSLSSSQANFNGNYTYGGASKGRYLEKTAPVGSYQPNSWGLYDMHGNLWEWCEDIYNDSYRGLTVDGSANLSLGDSDKRVLRGGSWFDGGFGLRSAVRGRDSPAARSDVDGFRFVARPSAQ